MILRTTNMRASRMLAVTTIGDGLLSELTRSVVGGDRPRSRLQIEMCYSACVKLRGMVYDRCYTSKDTMQRGLSSSEHGALRDLVKAENEEGRHPALRGVGMAGHETRVFHAWRVGPDLWSPYPIEGAPFEILKPYWALNSEYPSEKFTLWTSDDRAYAPPSRLDDEALHWRFV